jgi:hypothetical protein
MIRTLRSFFLGRLFREKLLLTGFILMVTVTWLVSLSGRTTRFVRNVRITTSTLQEQQLWLANKAAIEAQAQAAAGKLDAVRTLDATRLLAEVSALATDSGLKNTTIGEAKDSPIGQISVHSLQLSVTKVDWATLKQFYLELGKRSPYIGIEQYSMQVDRANPTLLNASFQLSSVEISRN